mmetsp:Transcript_29142/g.58736  ORF Transcript_29142/g.58736 Transcript_29142/m.58736 type:complete len:99 (-) Transcript_29142:601-897(-)
MPQSVDPWAKEASAGERKSPAGLSTFGMRLQLATLVPPWRQMQGLQTISHCLAPAHTPKVSWSEVVQTQPPESSRTALTRALTGSMALLALVKGWHPC